MTRGSVSRKRKAANDHDEESRVIRKQFAKDIQNQQAVAKDDNPSREQTVAKDARSDSALLSCALHVKTSTSDHGPIEGAATNEPSQPFADVLQVRETTSSLPKLHKGSTDTSKDFHRPRTQREIPPLSRLEIL